MTTATTTEATVASDRTPGIGQRSTRQRTAVVGALDEIDDFRSTQEIHDYLRGKGENVGLTTVYRTLTALAEVDPRKVQVFELRFFGGLTAQQVAQLLDISLRTVNRDWELARAWLYGRVIDAAGLHSAHDAISGGRQVEAMAADRGAVSRRARPPARLPPRVPRQRVPGSEHPGRGRSPSERAGTG